MFQNLVSYKIWYLDSAKIIEMKMFLRFNVINIFFLFAKYIKNLASLIKAYLIVKLEQTSFRFAQV